MKLKLTRLQIAIVCALSLFMGAITLVPSGCATSNQRTVYNTLATIKGSTDTAFNGYLDLILKKSIPTNSFPVVTKDYNLFQTVWGVALTAAQFSTNALAPADVVSASAQVIVDINKAKGLQ
jgi:hypothetical protein